MVFYHYTCGDGLSLLDKPLLQYAALIAECKRQKQSQNQYQIT
jgi:hypothetical protein